LILSHTFTFQTQNSEDKQKILENIIAITEEDEKKHFVQYIQYESLTIDSIALRYVNIKVDRSYYLEMANVNLNNKNRRRYLFSVLGKRRFGANSKRIDYYLHNTMLKEDILENEYRILHKHKIFIDQYTQKSEYSINEYNVMKLTLHDSTIYFLDQINVTQRKRIYKTFCIELQPFECDLYKNIESSRKKIEYLFNKIGKIYFKSLEFVKIKRLNNFKTNEELALSKLVKSSVEMETTSRINDNLVFRKLQERTEDMGRVDKNLYTKYIELLNHPESKELVDNFYDATDIYIEYIDGINQLIEVKKHFLDIKLLVELGSIPYLARKKDNDLKDIFLYMLESFTVWNSYLHDKSDDVKSFNIATIDFIDSIRYLVDTCYKFKHEYKCNEIESTKSCPINISSETIAHQEISVTSADKFFSEIELDSEIYDELNELEHDIELLQYTQDWNDELQEVLIKFFDGYTSALNPLFEFKDLSYSLMLLSQKLQEYKINENSEILLSLLKYFIQDLLEWKRTVLVEKTAEDIHYMDKSFYSNIAQIELSIEKMEEECDDMGDIEFF